MLYVEFLIDDEPYELELRPGMVFTKCARCGQKIYGYFQVDDETELLCEACTPPPPDPKKKLIEYLRKHVGVTFTEEEMDTFFVKGDPKLLLDEINRRQKASRRGKGRLSAAKSNEKHPSVKIIPATK
ncbi:MAG: hypothetical protein II885_15095 [Oscillospiraceae bacterium]|nr:hypothetical protein [Oscillospiraceae bacterium]